MICTKCKELGQKSTIRIGTSMSTCANYQPYYDEEGVYHSHDGNSHSTTYHCSNGHNIYVSQTGTCPNCDFGKDSYKVTVKDAEPLNCLKIDGSGVIGIKND